MKPLLIVLTLVMIGGCASLSKDQCHTADWMHLGEHDAFEGHSRERLRDHGKACGEHQVTPDEDAYLAGYERGLLHFCLPQRGFDFGHAGSSYRNTCPVEREAAFQKAYKLGKALHAEEGVKSGVQSKIREKERKLKKASTDEERATLRTELRELDDDLIDSHRKLRRLDEDIRNAGLAR